MRLAPGFIQVTSDINVLTKPIMQWFSWPSFKKKKKKKATSRDLGKSDCVFSQSWEKLGFVPQYN